MLERMHNGQQIHVRKKSCRSVFNIVGIIPDLLWAKTLMFKLLNQFSKSSGVGVGKEGSAGILVGLQFGFVEGGLSILLYS